jgi:hypothetical protein
MGANLMRFGSYLAAALMILYTGRRYYASVVAASLGRRRSPDTPSSAVWGSRLAAMVAAVTVGLLRSAGLGWGMAAAFVGLELIVFLVMARMIAETGTFFMQHQWAPVGVLTGLLGFEAVGPEAYIALAVGSTLLFSDSRELLMPYLTNALKIVDRDDGPTPARTAPWMALVIGVGMVVAGTATLWLQYNHGATQVGNPYATDYLPLVAFDGLAQRIAAATADGSLARATAAEGLGRLLNASPDSSALLWVSVGLAFSLGAAVARLRWAWWPLHPIAFLVWGTYPIAMFGPSFLIGWMIKAAVVGTTGARGYHQVKPLMIGVIAGELLIGLFWMLFGAGYYFITDRAPASYSIFPL